MKRIVWMLLALCMLICSTAAAEQSFTPGTYEAVGQGKNGHVAVSVTFSDTAVTDIQIGENEETPGICENVFNTIPQEILERQSLNVDCVTGATLTSQAVLDAVIDAVIQAGGNPDEMMEETAKKEETVEIQTDVVIVGAGGTGLSAALEAAQAGAKVVVVEAQAYPGGATAMSGGWLLRGANEEEAAQYGALTSEQLAQEYQIYGTEWHDRALSEAMLNESTEITTWITEIASENGYKVQPYYDAGYYPLNPEDETSVDYTQVYTMQEEAHETGGDGYGFWITDSLLKKAKEAGVTFYLNTTATELLDENGAAAGIAAKAKDGTQYVIHASSVILACGGFGANKEMATRYNGAQSDYLGPKTNEGWGIFAAEKLGARTEYAYIAAMDEEMIYTDLYNTIGGVVVNGNMEVTNEQGEAIPGLYAGGEMACVTVMDPPHFSSGHNILWGLYSGRIAGQRAAQSQ